VLSRASDELVVVVVMVASVELVVVVVMVASAELSARRMDGKPVRHEWNSPVQPLVALLPQVVSKTEVSYVCTKSTELN
jgi:hypothetical protein